MRVERFKQLLQETLAASGHPDITAVDTFKIAGEELTGLKVTCADGVTLYLQVIRTSPPGGDDHKRAERIVTKNSA